MTKQETLKILSVLMTVYPKHFENTDVKSLAKIWHSQLADCEYADVDKAVKAYISTNETNFSPSIGKLRSIIAQSKRPESAHMTAQEATSLLLKAISNSGWHASEEFAKLPPIIQRVVRTPQMLFEWSQMDMGTLHSVIMSNFQRSYQTAVKQEAENQKLPDDLKFLPDRKAENLLNDFGEKLKLR